MLADLFLRDVNLQRRNANGGRLSVWCIFSVVCFRPAGDSQKADEARESFNAHGLQLCTLAHYNIVMNWSGNPCGNVCDINGPAPFSSAGRGWDSSEEGCSTLGSPDGAQFDRYPRSEPLTVMF
jgi:hypothetical protein